MTAAGDILPPLRAQDVSPAGGRARWRRSAPPLLLLALGVAVHFVGLSHPRSVVFDEVHFGGFVSAYLCDHRYFFDIHPPHAKLLVAGVAKLLGYPCGQSFDTIGHAYAASPAALRALPALAGTSLPLLAFALLRLLGASSAAALLGGLLLLFDNALTLHTRIIEPDGVLIASTLGALALWLTAERSRTATRRTLLVGASGALIGLAVGSKFLGLAVVPLIGVLLLRRLVLDRRWSSAARWIGQAAFMAFAALIVYAAGWVLHFELLTQPGPGDVWGPRTGHLLADIVETHRRMLAANVGLQQTHPYGSPWWSWPIMVRPIFYWVSATSPARMYLVGNPVVWWGGSLLFLVVLANLALSRVTTLHVTPRPDQPPPPLWLPILGFVAFYGPLVGVHRVLFMYHYFTPLIFSLLTVVLWLDHAGWTRPGGLLRQRASYYGAIAAVVAGFVLFAPLTFGLRTGARLADAIFQVFPAWR